MRLRLAAGLLSLALVVTAASAYLWVRASNREGGFDLGRNAIWLDVVWANRAHEEDVVADVVRDLADKRFRYAYVYVNSVQASGEPVPSTYTHAGQFVAAAKRAEPDLRFIAWVGVVNQARGQGKVPIDEPAVRANIAAFSRELTGSLGFDGVQLNVEPLPNGSGDFLLLLDEVREAIGPDKLLSIAGHKWAPDIVPLVERYSSYWKTDYYREVGRRVDQVAVMTYDSYAPTAEAYRLFQREQTLGVLNALADTGAEVLIGVPTYHEPRQNHNPEAENMESGLRGVIDALARVEEPPAAPFAGVAVYAHWETDQREWSLYRDLWLDQGS